MKQQGHSRGFILLVGGLVLITMAGLVLVTATGQGPRLAGHATGEPFQIVNAEPFAGPEPAGGERPQVPAGLRVSVPDLKIDLPVVNGDGVTVPLNQAALFPGLGAPGAGRRSVLYAHAQPGMFGGLAGARKGTRVTITSSAGHVLRYEVTEVHPDWPVSDRRWLEKADGEQLVLIACTTYNPFDPRVVVVASPA